MNSVLTISRRPVLLCDFELSPVTHTRLIPVLRESWFLINSTSEYLEFVFKKEDDEFLLDCDIHVMLRKVRE